MDEHTESPSLTQGELAQMAAASAATQLAETELKVAALSHRVDMLVAENEGLKIRLDQFEKDAQHVANVKTARDKMLAARQEQRNLAGQLGDRYNVDWKRASFHPETGAITLHPEESKE